ncbi:hypothetical protein T492DRAFT_1106700, partial [Pavlovales sp. CCMP2436]
HPLCCTLPRAVGSAPSTLPGGRCAPGTLRQARCAELCSRCCAFGAVPLDA